MSYHVVRFIGQHTLGWHQSACPACAGVRGWPSEASAERSSSYERAISEAERREIENCGCSDRCRCTSEQAAS